MNNAAEDGQAELEEDGSMPDFATWQQGISPADTALLQSQGQEAQQLRWRMRRTDSAMGSESVVNSQSDGDASGNGEAQVPSPPDPNAGGSWPQGMASSSTAMWPPGSFVAPEREEADDMSNTNQLEEASDNGADDAASTRGLFNRTPDSETGLLEDGAEATAADDAEVVLKDIL